MRLTTIISICFMFEFCYLSEQCLCVEVMSDTKPTQISVAGRIPVPRNVIITSGVDSKNATPSDSQETSKRGFREKLLAQMWPVCWLGVFAGLAIVCCVQAAE